MKVLQINATCGKGSTGKICVAISQLLNARNIDNHIVYTMGDSDYAQSTKSAGNFYFRIQSAVEHVSGGYGLSAKFATKQTIKVIEDFSPDIVHIHNIHSHDISFELLFQYLKEKQKKVIWTFHDCWAFTGYCPHFDMIGCEQWKTGCGRCPQFRQYSWIFDKSAKLYQKKKELFCGLDMTIVTPSSWLAELVKQSFLGDCPVQVIHNGIDLSVFKPSPSNFRKEYHLDDKFILLGVAFDWGRRKGLDVFIELAKRLDKTYQIVLVGTNGEIDKLLPDNVISIHRTQNQQKLAEIYTAADVFVNPTREEVFGLVNVEALACGTPVITFNTGGSPECLDVTCGNVVPRDDVSALIRAIEDLAQKRESFDDEACMNRAKVFEMSTCFNQYIDLYENCFNI